MKHLFLLLVAGVLMLQSCNKNDIDKHSGVNVGPIVKSAFDTKYPNAMDIDWEAKGTYYVADFEIGNVDETAWFDHEGNWYMTEINIPYTALPAPVQTAFKSNSTYGSWIVDDVDMIERAEAETIYIIEAEQGNSDVELYYTAVGILVKTVFDADDNYDYDDFIPSELPANIQTYLDTNHAGYLLIEVDNEPNGMIKVEIVSSSIVMELLFSSAGEWISTISELTYTALPEIVKATIATWQVASTGYLVDDADLVEMASPDANGNSTWYVIEMENDATDREVLLKISADGTLIDSSDIP